MKPEDVLAKQRRYAGLREEFAAHCVQSLMNEIMNLHSCGALRVVMYDTSQQVGVNPSKDLLYADTLYAPDVGRTPALEELLEARLATSEQYLDFLLRKDRTAMGQHFLGGGKYVKGWHESMPAMYRRPTAERDEALLYGASSSMGAAFLDSVVGIGGVFSFPPYGSETRTQTCIAAGVEAGLSYLRAQHDKQLQPAMVVI